MKIFYILMKQELNNEIISQFLEGHNPLKYVIAIETSYGSNLASLVINDPNSGKYIDRVKFNPFLWIKHDVSKYLYDGDKGRIREAMKRFNVTIKELKTENLDGYSPKRMNDGFKFIVSTTESFSSLLDFFKQGGIDPSSTIPLNPNDPNSPKFKDFFMKVSPTEQFMIQTGIRLFKGIDDYDNLHRLQFDLETTGLSGKTDRIFQIGIRDNRGFEYIIEVTGNDAKELRDNERAAIRLMGKIIDDIKPDVITGYNSEDFDWGFIEDRCDRLSIDMKEMFRGLNGSPLYRTKSTLKLGGESQDYLQAVMWGTNILDISHAVRRAMAINSEIKKWSLKWITVFSKIVKPNRVYVPGDKIGSTWADIENQYLFNDTNGSWMIYDEKNQEHLNMLNNGYELVSGAYVVQRYLKDDLWETEKVDGIYNQASFLLSKIIPTSFMRSSTMGTASIWKLIMLAWSYENGLAIPEGQPSKTFTGGLSRLLEVGYAKNVVKLDYAALYPNTEITHDIFPDIDISGVMKGLLIYIAETRDTYKELKGVHGDLAKKLIKQLEETESELTPEAIAELKSEIKKNQDLSSMYDKKQLPIKILANSFFGSLGAPHVFPWGDIDCGEETTCRGRQYLRLMVNFFMKYNFRPLVMDTDGVNFAIPDNVDDITYFVKGNHRMTKDFEGQTLSGLKAVVAEFNEEYMIGRMGLDIDDVCNSTLNFARKNYANDIGGKVKLVGNSIKSNKMSVYIEEFINKGIRLLLDGKGYEFINLYYETVDNIVNYNIPLSKIASKARVKTSIEGYLEKTKKKNKAGNPMPRQAHMELVIQNNLNVNLGDTIYYVNIGTTKSTGDIKTVKLPNGQVDVILGCKLIPIEDVENNPNATTDEYNAAKYLAAFNTRIKPILVCFSKEIRDKIILNLVKDRKTKELVLGERNIFTIADCELTSGEPFEPKDQDDLVKDVLTMDDREVEFWLRVNKEPNHIDGDYWLNFKYEFIERKKREKEEGIQLEKEELIKIFERLELSDFNVLGGGNLIPSIEKYVKIVPYSENGQVIKLELHSKKWDVFLFDVETMFDYYDLAVERNNYYAESDEHNYESWLENREGNSEAITQETYLNIVCDEGINLEQNPDEINEVSGDTNDENEWGF